MGDNAEAPQSIHLQRQSRRLQLTWRNGECLDIPCEELRKFCACSSCRARQIVGSLLIDEAVDIQTINPIGSTGIQLVFADGHDRGIYPWPYLRAIAGGRAMDCIDGA